MNRLCVWIGAWVVLWSLGNSWADLRVMTFNTMCDVCGDRGNYGRFRDRLDAIADTIQRHDPDLISLQEIRTRGHVRRLERRIREKYHTVFAQGRFLNYTDAVLWLRRSRFEILQRGGFWLGPRYPRFSWGWKTGIPRRIEWVIARDRETGREFRFIGGHFDNSSQNKEPSAALIAEEFPVDRIPTIFAADSNLRPGSVGYRTLLQGFRDTFVEAGTPEFVSTQEIYDSSDGCGFARGDAFPECRIDHVLISRGAQWRVRRWAVDVERYSGRIGFASDHRAVIVDLEPFWAH